MKQKGSTKVKKFLSTTIIGLLGSTSFIEQGFSMESSSNIARKSSSSSVKELTEKFNKRNVASGSTSKFMSVANKGVANISSSTEKENLSNADFLKAYSTDSVVTTASAKKTVSDADFLKTYSPDSVVTTASAKKTVSDADFLKAYSTDSVVITASAKKTVSDADFLKTYSPDSVVTTASIKETLSNADFLKTYSPDSTADEAIKNLQTLKKSKAIEERGKQKLESAINKSKEPALETIPENASPVKPVAEASR